jgi:hypothetical protein
MNTLNLLRQVCQSLVIRTVLYPQPRCTNFVEIVNFSEYFRKKDQQEIW